ncbi:hypothetical protein C1H46_000399 [Malus baccata]|uniref:Uncharacterized protein n=1 Tax=Malus baccata TaxID=106549 RepID=A0A540NSJ1_MALBA|nr:hypothetical protein C1H46_000399 [Malus baccata]
MSCWLPSSLIACLSPDVTSSQLLPTVVSRLPLAVVSTTRLALSMGGGVGVVIYSYMCSLYDCCTSLGSWNRTVIVITAGADHQHWAERETELLQSWVLHCWRLAVWGASFNGLEVPDIAVTIGLRG